jgi:hypothetical protein
MNKAVYSILSFFVIACSPKVNSEQELKKTITLNELVSSNLSISVSKMVIQHFEPIIPMKQEFLNKELVKLGFVSRQKAFERRKYFL